MQYTEIFCSAVKKTKSLEKMIFFNIFAQNIDCWCTLDRRGSNEYPQSMFWIKKNKKNRNKP